MFYQVHLSAKDKLQSLTKIEVILHIIPLLVVSGIKIHQQVNITAVIKSIS